MTVFKKLIWEYSGKELDAFLVTVHFSAHQWGFTQQFAASDQVSNGDVEVRVAAAPVGDFGEGVSGEDVL